MMYTPVLNSDVKARELIDIVREQTDAPIGACVNTVSHILGSLLRELPNAFGLREIKNALEKEDVIDVYNCYDAKRFEALTAHIMSQIECKCQLESTVRDDESVLLDALRQFCQLLVNLLNARGQSKCTFIREKADPRIVLASFRRNDYTVIQGFVVLYQMQPKKAVRTELLSALNLLCSLDRSFVTSMVDGSLPVLLVLHNKFETPFTDIELSALELLGALFSTGEKFPISHYDQINMEFLTKMISLTDEYSEAFQFILSFNYHFEPNESTVIKALHNKPPVIFGQLLTTELNNCRADSEDVRALKLVMDIFRVPQNLVTTIFYDNDLKVLYGILCQELIDTNRMEKITMILEIMKNIDVMKRCGYVQEVVSTLKVFTRTREVPAQITHIAQLILQHDDGRGMSPLLSD